jgi:membrane protease YdiL (CAAX protease family)
MDLPDRTDEPRGLTPTTLVVIPVIFALALLITIQLASTGLRGGDYQNLTQSSATLTRQALVPHAIFLLMGLAVVAYLRLWRDAGFLLPFPGVTSRRWTLVPAALMLLGVVVGFATALDDRPVGYLVVLFVAMMTVGFNEEVWFRGIVLSGYRRTMDDRGAIIVTAVLFGLGHLINAALGLSIGDVLTQVVATTIGGIVFGVIRVRTGSIFPAVATHGFYDAALLSLAPDAEEFGTLLLGRLAALVLVAAVLTARRQRSAK